VGVADEPFEQRFLPQLDFATRKVGARREGLRQLLKISFACRSDMQIRGRPL